MCKFTTIILLYSFIAFNPSKIYAQNIDYSILKSINNSTTGLKSYAKFISNSTKITAVSVPVVMGTVALIQKNDLLLKDAIYVGVSIGLNTVLTYGLKYSINRPRPYVTHTELIVHPELYESSASFPSGHTSLAFSTATALSLKYRKWYVIAPSFFWASSVAYSRMNLGVHYPSDVLAGAALGAGSAYLSYKINEWFWKKQKKKKLLFIQSYL